jgi:integrase
MAIFTAARRGMVRRATWEDIDFEEGTWTVPDERMKMRWDYSPAATYPIGHSIAPTCVCL